MVWTVMDRCGMVRYGAVWCVMVVCADLCTHTSRGVAVSATGRDLASPCPALPTPTTARVPCRGESLRSDTSTKKRDQHIEMVYGMWCITGTHTESSYNPDGVPVLDSDGRGLCWGHFPSLHRGSHETLKE